MLMVYTLILCVSALLMAWAAVRVARRVLPMLGLPVRVGACVLVPATSFLMVLGAPAPMLMGAILIFVVLTMRARRHDVVLVPVLLMLAAVLIGMTGLHAPTATYLSALPAVSVSAAAGLLWFCLTGSAMFASASARMFLYGTLASVAVLGGAPLLVPATLPIAQDAAIFGCALLGVLLAGGGGFSIGLAGRLGVGFILAYLQLAALWQGAWVAGLASIAVWVVAIGWSWAQQDLTAERHAA